jgi:hypothetical protein
MIASYHGKRVSSPIVPLDVRERAVLLNLAVWALTLRDLQVYEHECVVRIWEILSTFHVGIWKRGTRLLCKARVLPRGPNTIHTITV